MKKTLLIAAISFILGIMITGYILVFAPEQEAPLLSEIASTAPSSNLFASPPPQAKVNLDFASLVDRMAPAVVFIEVEKVERRQSRSFFDDDLFRRFFGNPRSDEQEFRTRSQGTGFFISPDGYILTNNHIVERAINVAITTKDGEEFKAEIIGTDPLTDLALVKVKTNNHEYANLGDSDALRVGEWVMAIGNPLGLAHTVTAGIVSAKGRQIMNDPNSYQDFIQTDAAINQGNSGGPLVNTLGEVVGINSIIFSGAGGNIGIGFSISSNLAKTVVKNLKEHGRVIRSVIGVGIYAITSDFRDALGLKNKNGAIVGSVDKGGPADKAGLKRYDVITELNGVPIEDRTELRFSIADTKPGSTIELTILRKPEGKGKELEKKILKVKIKEMDSDKDVEQGTSTGKDLGFKIDKLTSRIAKQLGYDIKKGLVITEVEKYSEAERKGLRKYDVILEINQNEVTEVGDLRGLLKKAEPGDSLLLLVYRQQRGGGGDEFFVTLRIPE